MSLLYTLLFLLLTSAPGLSEDAEQSAEHKHKLAEGEKKLSEQILLIMEHFKDPDPIGLPGAEIPDPYPVPNTKQSFGLATMNFMNMKVHNISKFKIVSIEVEVGQMEVQASMLIERLLILGNYTVSTIFSRSSGPFNVKITDLLVTARANLGVERHGHLRSQDINIDLKFNKIDINFENLGVLGNLLQGMVASIGNFLFDSIKPYVLKEAYTKARVEIDKKLDEVAGDIQFPNSISPLDMVITKLRKQINEYKYDPFLVQDHNATVGIFTVSVSNTWLTGLSTLYRKGNITLKMENNTLIADVHIATQKLFGNTIWDVSAIGGLLSRTGTATFSVEYISARVILAQSLDTRNHPVIRDIDAELGNIQVRSHGAGTLDYVIEFAVNVIPNLLRYQIVDAIERPTKDLVQSYLDNINVEETIKESLPAIDSAQEKGFKLSSLMSFSKVEEPKEEDQFFDF